MTTRRTYFSTYTDQELINYVESERHTSEIEIELAQRLKELMEKLRKLNDND